MPFNDMTVRWIRYFGTAGEHVYPFKFTDVVTTTTHVPPRTKGGHDLLQGCCLYGLSQEHCDPVLVAQKVCVRVYMGVTTSQLDELGAETAAALTASQHDYASLAARIDVSNLPPSGNSLCGARK
ncbi:hypothetical protein VPH35_095909 [Triticum aestivum]